MNYILTNLQNSTCNVLSVVPQRTGIDCQLLFMCVKSIRPKLTYSEFKKDLLSLYHMGIIKVHKNNNIVFNPKIKKQYLVTNPLLLKPYIKFIFDLNLNNKKIFNRTKNICFNIIFNLKHLLMDDSTYFNYYDTFYSLAKFHNDQNILSQFNINNDKSNNNYNNLISSSSINITNTTREIAVLSL